MKRFFFFGFILFDFLTVQSQDSTYMRRSSEESLKQLPVLWQQTAAEYRALCYQAFNIAEIRISALKKRRHEKRAIITDLDETILDNSYSEANLIKDGKEYSSAEWKRWVNQSAATEVPGAAAFLQWAHTKGLTIFYISNRDTSQVMATLQNLKKLQLPNADTAHMMFSSNTSSKETRRQRVMGKYKVVMLLGDNLNDFTQFFETKNIADRKTEVDKVRKDWGDKFIVLPNSTYGEWENALYDYERKLTPQQKEEKRENKLIGY
ncbi:MAG: 5'-nucleotidase, lipoprotein e(P4) family [Chitinophagaceae bacterium]|nr:5'-nucleotidase, lipoprotein e(P4) family [Chitinophagaceae bacterium]